MTHYAGYFWKGARPQGQGKLRDIAEGQESFRMISDPYHKRLSVEHFMSGRYLKTVYDSNAFDFRHLNPQSQVAWKREILEEKGTEVRAAIRNIDDRVIYIEESSFQNDKCIECRILSPIGLVVGVQSIYYELLGAHFNGVVLHDAAAHPVMWKRYSVGERGDFEEVLEEQWDMAQNPPPVSHCAQEA